jgi:hypothetical protein
MARGFHTLHCTVQDCTVLVRRLEQLRPLALLSEDEIPVWAAQSMGGKDVEPDGAGGGVAVQGCAADGLDAAAKGSSSTPSGTVRKSTRKRKLQHESLAYIDKEGLLCWQRDARLRRAGALQRQPQASRASRTRAQNASLPPVAAAACDTAQEGGEAALGGSGSA